MLQSQQYTPSHLPLEDLVAHDLSCLSFLLLQLDHISWAVFRWTGLVNRTHDRIAVSWVALTSVGVTRSPRGLCCGFWWVRRDAAGRCWPGPKNILSVIANPQCPPQGELLNQLCHACYNSKSSRHSPKHISISSLGNTRAVEGKVVFLLKP